MYCFCQSICKSLPKFCYLLNTLYLLEISHTESGTLNKAPISISTTGEEGQARPVLSRGERHLQGRAKVLALQAKPVLSGGESHIARQGRGIALKPSLS